MRSITAALAALLGMLAASEAHAWDGSVYGKVASLGVVADGENYGFRVYLEGGAAVCGTSDTWAYANTSASNYDVMVSILNSAFLAGKAVTIYTYVDAQGHCKMDYIALSA